MASFGEELKRERELRGISLKEIAEATKISIRFLEALEQDKFDMLPGGVFNRGFIRAYARFIGVDGEEMVNAYMEQVASAQAHRREQGRPGAAAAATPHVPVFRPPTLPKRLAARPLPEVHFGAFISRIRELTEGRTSLILWGLALVAFVIGAAVIALSLMRGNGNAAPVTETVARHEPVPAANIDGAAGGLPPSVITAGAEDTTADANTLTSPATGSTGPEDDAVAGGQRDEPGPFVSRPSDEPLRSTDAGPLSSAGAGAGAPAESAPPEKVHALTVVASEITRVRIECGGRVALFQELWPGQEAALRCAEPVVLSADNAGAVQYSLGGRTPALLGAPGQRVEAATIAPAARTEKREDR